MDFIVLCAGLSERFGKENKLLAVYDGLPLCVRSVGAALRAALALGGKVTVVTGYQAPEIQRALTSCFGPQAPLRFVFNDRFASGQFSSVQAGLGILQGDSDFYITPGDLPLVTAENYLALSGLLGNHDAVRPRSESRNMPGHPVLLSSRMREVILRAHDGTSVRSLLADRDVLPFVTEDRSFFVDIDTPSDLVAEL